MFKTTLISLSFASLFAANFALAADAVQVEPGKGPTETMTKQVPEMTPADGKSETGTTNQGAATNTNSEAAPVSCTQDQLTALMTKAGALTDKEKQKMTMGHLQLAKKSMDIKDTNACVTHMKEASNSLGTVTK